MDSLNNLIGQRDLIEPPEIKIIKDYVFNEFHSKVNVKIQPNQIIIMVENAALAGSLRMHLVKLQKLIDSDKKLIIYIGTINQS